jgi:hypothetical protein
MIYRAYRMPRLEIRPSGTTPGGIFHLQERGGGVEQDRTRTQTIPEISGWRTRPNFFGQIFLGKNFGNKNRVVSIPEERVLRQRRSRMKLAGSGEHGVDPIAIAASRVGS